MTDNKPVSETPAEYKAEESRYFRNVGAPKGAGKSATDADLVEKILPPDEHKHQILDRYERGFTKSSRSGAFSKAGSGPAIFPNGLGFASEFIDSMTPKREKPKEEMKPLREQTRAVDVPKAAAVIVNRCIDCMEETGPGDNVVPAMRFMLSDDEHKHFAMGVKYGDIVLAVEHYKCWNKANNDGQNAVPLVLAVGANLTLEEDIRIANKYGFSTNLHDGHERTLGQWLMLVRQDRLETNIEKILMAADKDDPLFYPAKKPKSDA